MEISVTFTEAALRAAGELLAAQIRANVYDGNNADGQPLPPGIDLRQTGRLLNDLVVTVDPSGEVSIEYRAPYASITEERYHWAGLPERALKEIEPELVRLLMQGATLTIKE